MGFKNEYPGRLSGFLNEELKVGGYYYGFILLALTFLLLNHRKFFYISFLVFFLTAVLIGERANLIKIMEPYFPN